MIYSKSSFNNLDEISYPIQNKISYIKCKFMWASNFFFFFSILLPLAKLDNGDEIYLAKNCYK